MRIISGLKRGKKLFTPVDERVRPTADRAREALFNILNAKLDNPFAAYDVMDVFAGTGALGLEAASRGARSVLFVDIDTALAEKNAKACGFGNARFLRRDARLLPKATKAYNVVFLDAPYNKGLSEPSLQALLNGGWLADGALIVVETAADETLDVPACFELEDERRYGAARFTFLTFQDNNDKGNA